MNEQPNQPWAWIGGKLFPLNEIQIPATDRSLEHGIGLFESMRATCGLVPLWKRHRERLLESASQLNIPITLSSLPAETDFKSLLEVSHLMKSQARLRLTLSGGSPEHPPLLWVAAHPIHDVKIDNLRLSAEFWPVDPRDPLVRHKTLNYWLRRRAHETAVANDSDESLSIDFNGNLWEASRSALFLVIDGVLIAPPADGPYLKSVSAKALEELMAISDFMHFERRNITETMLAQAEECILVNAVRGIQTVAAWKNFNYCSPGPVAVRLRKMWAEHYF